MRATARVLGISRNTVRRYVLAGGPPGGQGAASSTEQRPAREDIFAEPVKRTKSLTVDIDLDRYPSAVDTRCTSRTPAAPPPRTPTPP